MTAHETHRGSPRQPKWLLYKKQERIVRKYVQRGMLPPYCYAIEGKRDLYIFWRGAKNPKLPICAPLNSERFIRLYLMLRFGLADNDDPPSAIAA